MKAPLQEVDVSSGSLAAFETLGRLLGITTAIIGSRSRQGEDELRMNFGGTIDAIVDFDGDDSA